MNYEHFIIRKGHEEREEYNVGSKERVNLCLSDTSDIIVNTDIRARLIFVSDRTTPTPFKTMQYTKPKIYHNLLPKITFLKFLRIQRLVRL